MTGVNAVITEKKTDAERQIEYHDGHEHNNAIDGLTRNRTRNMGKSNLSRRLVTC